MSNAIILTAWAFALFLFIVLACAILESWIGKSK
jgi:pilus assembly protein TadC